MPTDAIQLGDGTTVRAGRIPPDLVVNVDKYTVVFSPTGKKFVIPNLGAYFNGGLDAEPPPLSTNYRAKGMESIARKYLNDQYGDCVIASKYHQVGIWTGNKTGTAVQGTDQEVLSSYHGICGRGDNGCVITDVLDVFKSTGLPFNGVNHKIDDYVAIDWTNKLLMQVAIDLFGGGCFGIDLPSDWTCTNCVWDENSRGNVGGHDVDFMDYNEQGVQIATWGGVVTITWAAVLQKRFITEAYIELSPDWYGSDKLAPNGIDVATLKADLDMLRSGQIPPIVAPILDWTP